MATKQRGAQQALDTNFGGEGMLGSDGSQEAADAWFSVLAGGEEHDEEDAAGGSPDDDGQEAAKSKPKEPEAEDDEAEDDEEEDNGEEDPDEDGEEDDEEDSDEEDEGPAQDLDPNAKVKVKVDGEETEVTLKELKDGYSRTQDYTRKTQQVAEERRGLEAERDEVLQQRQQWSQLLDQLKPRIQAQLSGRSEEDWARLKAEDELTYYEERDKERAAQQRIEAIQQEQAQVQRDQQARQQKQLQEYARKEKDLLFSKIPEWSTDDKLARQEVDQMREYGTEIGFSKQEVDGIIDHRALLALRDAAKYRALQKVKDQGKPKVRKKQRTLKPGTPSNEAPSRANARKAKQRLAKTKTVDAAAGVFEQFLDSE